MIVKFEIDDPADKDNPIVTLVITYEDGQTARRVLSASPRLNRFDPGGSLEDLLMKAFMAGFEQKVIRSLD